MSLLGILGWLIILAVIALAAYFVFFREPQTVEYLPKGFEYTEGISSLDLNPAIITTNPEFTKRNDRVPSPERPPVGRSNPFLAP